MIGFPYKIVDLTHTVSADMPTWDGKPGFDHSLHCDHDPHKQYKFRKYKTSGDEGIGTHIDAPIHCIPNGISIHEISLDSLITPCCVVDVSKNATPDYKVSENDIHDFESSFGEIKDGSFVIIRTGWDRYWNDQKKYRNDLKFPMVSQEAALLLLKRNVTGLGVDTLSPDGPDAFPIHNIMLGNGKHLVENIANTDQLPCTGAFSLILPMKIGNGAEAPARVIGLIPL